jgi:putative chitinase
VEAYGFQHAHEGRKDLGNTETGDGTRYIGRGLIQLTGQANYRKFAKALSIDLENNPAQAAEPKLSLRLACEFWNVNKINHACDNDDVVEVTKIVNGGHNGLNDRRHSSDRAKKVLGLIERRGEATSGRP